MTNLYLFTMSSHSSLAPAVHEYCTFLYITMFVSMSTIYWNRNTADALLYYDHMCKLFFMLLYIDGTVQVDAKPRSD